MHSNHKKQFLTILLIVFIGFLGISMPYLIFPALFLNPAYSIFSSDTSTTSHAILLGITLAAYPLGQFFGSPILGALSDEYGRKRLLSLSLVGAALCYLMTGIALEWKQILLVIVSRFGAGLMEGNIAIARAMAQDLKTLSKHDTFGKINAAASTAYLIGPLLGGLLADNKIFVGVTISTPFYIVSILFFGLSLLAIRTLQSKNATVAASKRKSIVSHFNLVKKLSIHFRNKTLRFLLIISTFFTLAIDIFYEFGPVYLTDKWMLGPIQLIAYNSALCIAGTIGNAWFASFFSKRYSSQLGIIGAIGAFSFILFGIVLIDHTFSMLVLFSLSGLAIGLGVTLLTVKISDSSSDSVQGEVMGVQVSLRVLGDALICLLGGFLLLFSSKLILVFAAVISLVTMIYYQIKNI